MSHTPHTAAENKAQLGWDPDDPHGINPHHGEHHHYIADWRMQVTVLVVLLFFTALTVAFFNFEGWAEGAFGIVLPGWVNIAGAMSIATIKGILVAAFFMQLRYDKALNTFALLACLGCVALFLGFSMIDLGSRHMVTAYKGDEVTPGGTGYMLDAAPADEDFFVRIGPRVNTGGASLIYAARRDGNAHYKGLNYYRETPDADEADFWAYFYGDHATHRDPLDEENYFVALGYGQDPVISDANKSRPRRGLTPGLFSDVAPPTGHGPHRMDHASTEAEAETGDQEPHNQAADEPGDDDN